MEVNTPTKLKSYTVLILFVLLIIIMLASLKKLETLEPALLFTNSMHLVVHVILSTSHKIITYYKTGS